MDVSVTIATHVGPLMTQIRDTDTVRSTEWPLKASKATTLCIPFCVLTPFLQVQSFMEELKSNINRGIGRNVNNSWHLLLYKSRILSPTDRLVDVVTDPTEALVYVHPVRHL